MSESLKRLLQLSEESLDQLTKFPEAGMGYYYAVTRLPDGTGDRHVIVGGNNYVIPIDSHPEFFGMTDLSSGLPLPNGLEQCELTLHAIAASGSPSPGNPPPVTAVPLLATITIVAPTLFYRFTATQNDHRFVSSNLLPNTYLAPSLDRQYANTGFAAVGRYSLPIPAPASYVHEYTLNNVTLLAGTVMPQFGQSGGGVEVKTLPAAAVSATYQRHPKIDDF